MPFHPVQNCTMCVLRWSSQTNLCENTLAYFWSGVAPTGAELTSLATAIAGDTAFYFRRAMSDQIQFNRIECTNINAPGGAQGIYVFPPNTRGQRVGSQDALNVAAGIVRRTAFVGRSNRGRNSVSGFTEGDTDGNTLGSALMPLLGDIAIHLLVTYLSGRFRPAVASRANNIAIPLLAAAVLDNNTDSQKTRLNTHGT